jgi:hypothetical protein
LALLPEALMGVALGLGLLLAPAWADESAAEGAAAPRKALARAAFLGAWQAAAVGFFVLVAARVAPCEPAGQLRALLTVASALGLAHLVAVRLPRAYAGLMFLWAVAVPVGLFVLAEIFISTPVGAVGWRSAGGAGPAMLREVTDWLLCLSPGAAAIGTLTGELATGGACGWTETLAFSAACWTCAWVLPWRTDKSVRPT